MRKKIGKGEVGIGNREHLGLSTVGHRDQGGNVSSTFCGQLSELYLLHKLQSLPTNSCLSVHYDT